MGNNLGKAIGAVVVIILAVLLILWQVSGGKKTGTVNPDAVKQANAESSAALETLAPAMELAVKSGWNATGKYWAPNSLNTVMKKRLTGVFGDKLEDAQIVLKGEVSRDSESGMQSCLFQYNGKNYAFYLMKDKRGNYKLKDFGVW